MDLERFLEELSSSDGPISSAKLVHLSDLGPEEMQAFLKRWGSVPPARRRKLVSMLVEVAEDNVELDFNAIYRHTLTDEDDDVRVSSISGLWECEERSLVSPLIRLLNNDPTERVRAAAARALGRFALLAETGKLLERDSARVSNALLDVINSDTETIEVRRRAIEAIAPMSIPRVSEVIQEAYEDDDTKFRASALYAMGLNCDPKWISILIGELAHSDPEMRYEAVVALGEIGEDDVVPDIVPLFHDPDLEVQAAAFNALGSIGGPLAKNALSHARKSPDPHISDLADAAVESTDYEEEPVRFRGPAPSPDDL